MAELQPQSARQRTTFLVIIGILVIAIIAVVALFLSPNSPLRPKAAELTGDTSTFGPPQQAVFRNGTVSKISNGTVSVDEPGAGSFSFVLADNTIVRGLKNNVFEIVDHSQLHVGDFISVFYEQSDTAQHVSRVDIIQAK